MSSREATEKIWRSISGAEPLFTIYGYWPTLHDAVIRNVDIRLAEKQVEVTVDYDDEPLRQDESLNAHNRITLRWRGVSEARLRLYNGDLYGMEFAEEGGLIVTEFEQHPYGMDGFIRSASVEVINIEPAPDMSEMPQDYPIHHEISISLT